MKIVEITTGAYAVPSYSDQTVVAPFGGYSMQSVGIRETPWRVRDLDQDVEAPDMTEDIRESDEAEEIE